MISNSIWCTPVILPALSRVRAGGDGKQRTVPAPQLDDLRGWWDPVDNADRMALQCIDLGISQVVFVKISDILEQLEAVFIVKDKRGYLLLHSRRRLQLHTDIVQKIQLDVALADVDDMRGMSAHFR